MNRKEMLNSLKTQPPSVLIVGGGINGIGSLRDLALQGVDTLLIEGRDFCSGASAASSRMAHGGIRYLENGEFRLVREAVQERNHLLKNAPDLVKPLPTTIPIFKILSGLLNAPLKFMGWLERPSERGALVIKIGLLFYDAFTGKSRSVPKHVFLPRSRSLKRFPDLNPAVKFTATYYDGLLLSPERLAMEVLLGAEREGGHVRAINYMSLQGVEGKTVTMQDEESGKRYAIRPKVIVNAAGPWIDLVNRSLGLGTHYIGPTKGSHLVLDNPVLRRAIGEHEFFFENKDGRIVLIFPLFDKVMVGTSDLEISDPDLARCTEEEVDYFLEMIGRVFPHIPVNREQIIFRFAGVRPLAHSDAKRTGQITRDHHIEQDQAGELPILSLVGGKWTSFRAFSEQVTDRVLEILDLARKADTRDLPIAAGTEGMQLKTSPAYRRDEIRAIAEREKIVHLDDLLLRRTLLGYLGQLNLPLVKRLAGWLGECLGWDQARMEEEVRNFLALLEDRHQVHL